MRDHPVLSGRHQMDEEEAQSVAEIAEMTELEYENKPSKRARRSQQAQQQQQQHQQEPEPSGHVAAAVSETLRRLQVPTPGASSAAAAAPPPPPTLDISREPMVGVPRSLLLSTFEALNRAHTSARHAQR